MPQKPALPGRSTFRQPLLVPGRQVGGPVSMPVQCCEEDVLDAGM